MILKGRQGYSLFCLLFVGLIPAAYALLSECLYTFKGRMHARFLFIGRRHYLWRFWKFRKVMLSASVQ